MEQFVEVLKIRNMPIDTDLQAKRVIEKAINIYDIVPFVPIIYKLRFHDRHSRIKNFSPRNLIRKKSRTESTEPFSDFWMENMKRLSREFYFGRRRKFRERIRIQNKRFRFLPKYTEPIYQGELSMIAEDMKSEMIAKLLLKNYDNEFGHFILIDILAIRPLTFSEYISLFMRYPETAPFIDAALGFPYERLFNKIFEENTGVSFPIMIAPYLADVYPKQSIINAA